MTKASEETPKGSEETERMLKLLRNGAMAEDLDRIVKESIRVSMEGAGGLSEEDWIGACADRPFCSLKDASYAGLVKFIHENGDRSGDEQSFLHYMRPWYDWALRRAEAAFLRSPILRGSDFAAAADHEIIRVLQNVAFCIDKQ